MRNSISPIIPVIAVALFASAALAQDAKAKAEAFKQRMAQKLGTAVTVRGKMEEFKVGTAVLTDDGGEVMLRATKDTRQDALKQLNNWPLGTRIEVTGIIGFSPYWRAPTPLVSDVAEHHFIDLDATTTIRRLPVER